MKNPMALQNVAMTTNTKFGEYLSSSSLAQTIDPADKYDPHDKILVYARYRRMIYTEFFMIL